MKTIAVFFPEIFIDLNLVHCEPGGEMNYESGQYTEQVELGKAMTFMAKLKK